jgi:hypothetical protein
VQKAAYSQLKSRSANVAGGFAGSGVARWQNVDFGGGVVVVWARVLRPLGWGRGPSPKRWPRSSQWYMQR